MHLTRNQRNLPAIQSTTALAMRGSSAAALVASENPPRDVIRGVAILMLINPAPGRSPQEGQLLASVYYKAVAGVPEAVATFSLDWLQLHNPRNQTGYVTAPTPQDVHEACKSTNGLWQRAVVDFYFSGVWAKPSTNTMLAKDHADLLQRYYALQKGGKPGDADCIIPEDLQIEYLRREIARHLPDVEKEERRRSADADPLLLTIKDDVLERMPEVAFPDGALDLIRAKRAARAEAARKAAELERYIESLPDDARYIRWDVVRSEQWVGRDEPDILAETNRRLEIVKTARAKAEAEGGEFLGCRFGDGSEWHERDFKTFYGRNLRRAR
jgi:hypothetical protein